MATPGVSEETILRALDAFRAELRAKTQNMSMVREAIVRAALNHKGHFTVEELVRELKHRGVDDAHMATVYRAIPLLLEAKIIQPALVNLHGGPSTYEAAFERAHHDHLSCSSCGTVVEFNSEPLEALQREVAGRYGFELDDHVMSLSGLCGNCRKSKPAPRKASATARR